MIDKTSGNLTMDIAKRLTAMRLQRAWTREDLANRSGINVYTLKHFERTGQISLERLILLCNELEILPDLERVFKPRQRINVENWQAPEQTTMRKRGKRRVRDKEDETTTESA
ncbi:MAG: helix-turn-helix domain-containing protein [Gammaproteobacteria bacterium]|nr:helix-turn-helix domain-containing protein [Gammaproteobacteria bacterium]